MIAGIRLDKLHFYAISFEHMLFAVDLLRIKLFNFYKIQQKLKWFGRTVSCKALWDIPDTFSKVYLYVCTNIYDTYIIKIKSYFMFAYEEFKKILKITYFKRCMVMWTTEMFWHIVLVNEAT